MKKHILLFLSQLLLIVPLAFAQNFEGTITYSMTVDGEGEKLQQMRDAMPNKMIYSIKGEDMRIRSEGGMMAAMAGDIILKGKEKSMYILQPASQTAMRMKLDGTKAADMKKPVVTKMNETEKIAGYECTKYKVVTQTEQGDVISYLWVTNKLKVNLPKEMMQTGNQMSMPEDIDGFPLKVISNVNMGGMQFSMIFTATEVKKAELQSSEFSVPTAYTIQDMDPSLMGR